MYQIGHFITADEIAQEMGIPEIKIRQYLELYGDIDLFIKRKIGNFARYEAESSLKLIEKIHYFSTRSLPPEIIRELISRSEPYFPAEVEAFIEKRTKALKDRIESLENAQLKVYEEIDRRIAEREALLMETFKAMLVENKEKSFLERLLGK